MTKPWPNYVYQITWRRNGADFASRASNNVNKR